SSWGRLVESNGTCNSRSTSPSVCTEEVARVLSVEASTARLREPARRRNVDMGEPNDASSTGDWQSPEIHCIVSTTLSPVPMRPVLLFALAPSLLAAQAQPVPQTTAKPGWQWTMDSVVTVVNTVRAGRSLQPTAW